MLNERDDFYLRMAVEFAQGSFHRGWIPIAAVIADDLSIIATGVNRRVDANSMIRHAEMEALEQAGRNQVARVRGSCMYTTLSPCLMCTGAVLLFGVKRVVIADVTTHSGGIDMLRRSGVETVVQESPVAVRLMAEFTTAQPDLWAEDNGR